MLFQLVLVFSCLLKVDHVMQRELHVEIVYLFSAQEVSSTNSFRLNKGVTLAISLGR